MLLSAQNIRVSFGPDYGRHGNRPTAQGFLTCRTARYWLALISILKTGQKQIDDEKQIAD